ncbi:MAG: penicillin-binding protein activator [Nitrococcus sp.]|nr:penicillin-binding protein activator [Nitrococcus sp.]
MARLLFAFAAALPLVGCIFAPSGPTTSPADLETLLTQAKTAQANNDLTRGAALLDQAAALAQSPKREKLRLQAAQLYLDLNEPNRARTILKQLQGRELPPTSAALRRIVQARLALAAGDGAGALATLSPRPQFMPEALRAAWLEVEADARLAEGQPLAAARLRDERSTLLRKPASRQANQQALWSALLAIPMEELVGLIPPIPDRFGGWLELAYFYRTRQVDAQALTAALHAWQERYPNHPAAGAFLASVLTTARQSLQRPNAVALLLPLSGPLTAVGRAVEHGFMAAYYQDPPQQRPYVRIYDIGDSSVNSLSAYHDAVAGGADIVVGPLTKIALQRLTVLDFAPIPILGLNTLPSSIASIRGLYQFGLAPEDDAFAAAELAWQRGCRSAVILTQNSEWGDRVAQAFRERLQSLGGRVLELAHYAPQTSDFSERIEALLNLDVSVRRYKQLRADLRRDIQFQPRRREDMDCIFIGALPREARLIRPQIRFHYGMGVPVIATAQAYEGTPQPAADQDMNGLLLAEIPWLIPRPNAATAGALSRDRMTELWPQSTQHYPRLYALGMDAYRLTALIPLLHGNRGLQVKGRTGELTMDARGVIHRELEPAHFVDGLLQPLDIRPSPRVQPAQASSHD